MFKEFQHLQRCKRANRNQKKEFFFLFSILKQVKRKNACNSHVRNDPMQINMLLTFISLYDLVRVFLRVSVCECRSSLSI